MTDLIQRIFSRRLAALLLAGCALPFGAIAQSPAAAPTVACPAANELKAPQLYGLWLATFAEPSARLPARATMLLEKHAEFSESLAGLVGRDFGVAPMPVGMAAKAQLAGDIEDGMLLLDESSDGVSITGTWNGEVVAGSCGKAFRGVWKDTSTGASANASDIAFTLTRLP